MRTKLRRLCTTIVTTATLLAITNAVPAHAQDTTGSISGTLTEAGTPVSGGVQVFDSSFQFITTTTTDSDGRYTAGDLAPGGYKLFFFVGEFGQWAHGKVDLDQADTFTVAAGATTVVDEELLPSGSLGGVLTGGSAGILVRATSLMVGGQQSVAGTDDQGRFEMPRVHPGTYRVSFELPSGARQHYPGALDENRAQPVQVAAGQRTAIADALRPHGSTSGRLVENGVPVEGAQVSWVEADSGGQLTANTDADGRYRMDFVFAATYKVQFQLPDFRFQWAHGKLAVEEADTFAVTEGAETVVDETVLPTGEVRVRAVDAQTNQPVTEFCADVGTGFACAEDGVATFAKITAGRQRVFVLASSDAYLSTETTVDVPAGRTTELTVRLTRAAFITTVIRDRATGTPVAGACVKAIPLVLANLGASESCSDEQGIVRTTGLTAGTYTLFVQPQDGVHGMQWLGKNGGTGNQFAAQRITVEAGQTATAPPTRLDTAGQISGRVTDKRTGAPLEGAVHLLPGHPGGGEGPSASTDAAGRYTFGGLGPYDWPLYYGAVDHAGQWSGAAPSRLVATLIKVRAGKTTTANAALTAGTIVRGTGVPEPFAFVIAYDAVTGDILASTAGPGNTYQFRVLGPMAIKLRVDTGHGDRWHRRAADFAHATVVLVPSSGTKTVNLEL